MTNQINQQSKSDQKRKAIISLIFGISSIMSGLISIYLYGSYEWASNLIIIIYLLIPVIGIIFGIYGLKSAWKILSIVGIVLSTISLLGVLFLYFFIRMMAAGM